MVILLSNDDGYSSLGIQALRQSLSTIAKVYVVAPDKEQSAVSHKITFNQPIRIKQIDETTFTTDASPADCVKAAFLHLVPEKIDLVVSGINHGPNMGTDVFYSGTVAAAREGAIKGVPGIAFSLNSFQKNLDFLSAALWASKIVSQFYKQLQPGHILNVNFPFFENAKSQDFLGVKITKLGQRVYQEKFIQQYDPMGNPYYWLGGDLPIHNPCPGSDFEAVEQGFISATPLSLDITDYNILSFLHQEGENHKILKKIECL